MICISILTHIRIYIYIYTCKDYNVFMIYKVLLYIYIFIPWISLDLGALMCMELYICIYLA